MSCGQARATTIRAAPPYITHQLLDLPGKPRGVACVRIRVEDVRLRVELLLEAFHDGRDFIATLFGEHEELVVVLRGLGWARLDVLEINCLALEWGWRLGRGTGERRRRRWEEVGWLGEERGNFCPLPPHCKADAPVCDNR